MRAHLLRRAWPPYSASQRKSLSVDKVGGKGEKVKSVVVIRKILDKKALKLKSFLKLQSFLKLKSFEA